MALAFDHAEILGMVVKRLRAKVEHTPIGFELLPDRFTLAELQRVHETILGRALNKDSFRRRMVASGMIEATGGFQEAAQHRPAELFRFRRPTAD
jgi:8-oxo-dGTP diphosphatase